MAEPLEIPCIYQGGHLHGEFGLWDPQYTTRCMMVVQVDAEEPPLADGRVHEVVICQTYCPNLSRPKFIRDPRDPKSSVPVLVMHLQQSIETCNHDLH